MYTLPYVRQRVESCCECRELCPTLRDDPAGWGVGVGGRLDREGVYIIISDSRCSKTSKTL